MPTPHAAFSRRLHAALDQSGFARGRGRTSTLAGQYEVSREAARKWLSGNALPDLDRIVRMAVQTGVSFEWLATGRGEMKTDTRIREAPEHYSNGVGDKIMVLVRQLPPDKQRALLEFLGGNGAG